MRNQLNKSLIERYSRQIVLKDIGVIGQKKILNSKILIIGAGGLGCPVAEFLTRAGIGELGIVDFDKVNLSNLHRQSLFESKDIGKYKVSVIKNILKKINPNTKVKTYNMKLSRKNAKKILNNYNYIVDGSDNFRTKFLINDFCLKHKKILITGAIGKFDGHIFNFNFKNKKLPCLRCFFQDSVPSDSIINCETEGVLGAVAGAVGTILANEILKQILNIGKILNGQILILDFLNLNFRKVKLNKNKECICIK